MDRIFEDAKDIHVVMTKVYAKSGDTYAYSDSECTNKIDAATLQELFTKGLVVVDGGVMYNPVSFALASNVGTVTYVKANSSTPTTAVLATVKSN